MRTFFKFGVAGLQVVTKGKIYVDVSFFYCYLSVSLVILLVVMLNGDLFVQNINISYFFLTFSCFVLFLYSLFRTFQSICNRCHYW